MVSARWSGALAGAAVGLLEMGCGYLGQHTAITIAQDGRGLIAYQDGPNGLLKVAHCEDPACTRATISVVDGSASSEESGAGWYTSITRGADGLGLSTYQRSGAPYVAHCEDVACSRALISPVNYRSGIYATGAIVGPDGLGLLAFIGVASLAVAHCQDVACSSSTVSVVDRSTGTPRAEPLSMARGSDGLALIAHFNSDQGFLRMLHCTDPACTSASAATIDGPVAGLSPGAYPHVALGSDGLGIVSYADGVVGGNLRVAHCADVPCTRADTISIIDRETPTGRVGEESSIAIGPDGLALISYRGAGANFLLGDLRVAHCRDVACTSATVSRLDPTTQDVRHTSIAFGADGLGLVSYNDQSASPGRLKVAHCQDPDCRTATISILDGPARAPR